MTYTVYSKPGCPFCDKAKALLKLKGLEHTIINVDIGQPKVEGETYVPLAEFKATFPNQKTLPLILEDGAQVGGFTELNKKLNG